MIGIHFLEDEKIRWVARAQHSLECCDPCDMSVCCNAWEANKEALEALLIIENLEDHLEKDGKSSHDGK